MYLFVCFDLVICSRIDGFFGISTISVLILVFHEFGILCMRVKYFKKSPSGIACFYAPAIYNGGGGHIASPLSVRPYVRTVRPVPYVRKMVSG